MLALLTALFCVTVAGCGARIAPQPTGGLADEFTRLDRSLWAVPKGQPAVDDGWLLLTSTPGKGEEVQSLRSFRYVTIEFKATSQAWPVDTSLGAESWIGSIHQAVVVTNGHLGIINQSKDSPNEWYERIPDWDTIKGQPHLFRLVWNADKIDLFIDGKSALTYEGPLIPDSDLKVRLNASNDAEDTVKVDSVLVTAGQE